ncbi:MAG: toll/interleukin-1 receptor domain-containing protein [Alphaproteobacteria bacterium]|nr:toll/interleukin-1 receptor domain-containing protein [Alphaproteobacteria bacterium]
MAPPAAVATISEPMWDESLWEDLLAYIEAGIVVPIIGPASYKIDTDGRPMSVDAYVADRLITRLSLPRDDLPPEPTLNEVTSTYLRRSRLRQKLYPAIQGILNEARFTPPPVLRQLAEIRHFNLFVTTAFDPLLETAINQVRFGGEPRTQALAYAPNDVHDLPGAKRELPRPVVYYLMGRLSALPSYAISDDDLIEWLAALQSESLCPQRLLGELESNHLLIIGGTFSDWVVRIFLRTAKRQRLSKDRDVLEVLADDRSGKDPALVAFLRNFSPQTQIFQGDAALFVETLWQRWQDRHGAAATAGESTAAWVPPAAEMPQGAIFLSYAREDIDAVRRLKSGLDEAGLTVWFDFDRLEAGDSFDLKIQNNIRQCSLFVPVLSRNTEARVEGFFRREWNYALDRDKNIDPGVRFITPVVIDDTSSFAMVPPRFRDINITSLPEGRPTPEFVAQLKRFGGPR